MIVEIRGADGKTERLTQAQFEEQVRDGLLGPETLVRVEAVTGRRFRPLGTLELAEPLIDPEQRLYRQRVRYAAPLVTAALVGVQVRLYLWSKVPGVDVWLVDHLTNWAPAALELGEVHRLVTYGFLHLSFTHLALNMLFLAWAGANLERALGRRNLLSVWMVSVVAGGALSLWMSPGRPSLGASGGDFGLLAAAVIFGWKHEELLPDSTRRQFGWGALPYLIYPLLIGLQSEAVDNWGHLGGLLGGAVMATLLNPEGFTQHTASNRRTRRLALLSLGLGLGALRLVGPQLVVLEPLVSSGLIASRPSAWREGWAFTDDRGWLSPTDKTALVVTTRSYERPPGPATATKAFLDQLDDRASGLAVVRQSSFTRDGWPAQRVELTFMLGGVSQRMHALIITRGAFVHRVHLHGPSAYSARISALAERAFAEIRVTEPESLTLARDAVRRDPGSWLALVELGEQAGHAGFSDEAERAFDTAMPLAGPRRARVAAGLLELWADYAEAAEPARVEALLQEHPDDPRVVHAAAMVYAALGERARAESLLLAALDVWPNDVPLRRALEAVERGDP
ncbi:MAG: rhomboid family intramembrane serine protease [Deltaproteobacteria bacterium]|nr:rhomboid family intramembrane serine protease [Deltaproteobacteria bacterium]